MPARGIPCRRPICQGEEVSISTAQLKLYTAIGRAQGIIEGLEHYGLTDTQAHNLQGAVNKLKEEIEEAAHELNGVKPF